jgi:hypothetical protein
MEGRLTLHLAPKPSLNSLLLFGNLSVDNAGIGSVGIAISVAMFMAAFLNQTGCSSKQYPLGIVLSQKCGTGLHMKIALLTTLYMPYPTTIAKMIQHARYCRIMEILVKVSVAS